ncbi:MAG: adenosylcobinamide-GDP ribazoletransferase [Oscillospiraceae bacterium]|jgi:adenosylcobinamide-GDP ribazoletransferase|nr:adenosylcobinamide-GDP ribazoletransferase [Oscillospiraceae bacterium]
MNAPPKPIRIPKPLRAIVVAFGMYSRVPMPYLAWGPDSMAYALCGFPLVGAVVGAAVTLWAALCGALAIGATLRAAGILAIPVVVAGGIHLDGFCDVSDALSSHQPRERKLEIMKDSHVGAFAVITLCLYLLTEFAMLCEINFTFARTLTIAAIPVMTRALSAFAAVTLKNARDDGVLVTFTSAARPNAARLVSLAWFAAAAILMIICEPLTGVMVVLTALLSLAYYRWLSYKQFGGITGDLAGWFLQVCEWACLAATLAAQWI